VPSTLNSGAAAGLAAIQFMSSGTSTNMLSAQSSVWIIAFPISTVVDCHAKVVMDVAACDGEWALLPMPKHIELCQDAQLVHVSIIVGCLQVVHMPEHCALLSICHLVHHKTVTRIGLEALFVQVSRQVFPEKHGSG
jgi:hypothetical protein